MIVKLRIFGAFRKYFHESTLEVFLEDKMNVSDFKKVLIKRFKELDVGFNDERLVLESAIASDDEILTDDFELIETSNLAILPPVCGG